jgi:hypothetical protein
MRLRSLWIAGALSGLPLIAGCDALVSQLTRPIQSTPGPDPFVPTPTPTNPSPDRTPVVQVSRDEIIAQLKQATYLPLLTGYLINDGIGIFTGTTAASPVGARRWGRDYKDAGISLDDQAQVFVSTQSAGKRVVVAVQRPIPGTWLGDYPWRKSLVRKAFQDQFYREAMLEDVGGSWTLRGLSVAVERSSGASTEILAVTLSTANGTATYSGGGSLESRIMAVERMVSGLPGDKLQISVFAQTAGSAAFAYVGSNVRQALTRDSSGTRFTGEVRFPDIRSLGQIGIDLVATRTLEVVDAHYDATLWGVPVARKGGAL